MCDTVIPVLRLNRRKPLCKRTPCSCKSLSLARCGFLHAFFSEHNEVRVIRSVDIDAFERPQCAFKLLHTEQMLRSG